MDEQLTLPEIAEWAEAQLAVMQCYTRFDDQELVDIRSAALEHGVTMGALIHDAVMDSLYS